MFKAREYTYHTVNVLGYVLSMKPSNSMLCTSNIFVWGGGKVALVRGDSLGTKICDFISLT